MRPLGFPICINLDFLNIAAKLSSGSSVSWALRSTLSNMRNVFSRPLPACPSTVSLSDENISLINGFFESVSSNLTQVVDTRRMQLVEMGLFIEVTRDATLAMEAAILFVSSLKIFPLLSASSWISKTVSRTHGNRTSERPPAT